ncbi:MAG: metalloregulator ArsR/SmtB family transcription factor [Pseudomonadales bacterium]|nr:metalloregulator ArsR/SmtB family transcription factor [Pseudomonadales bacterium]
MSSIDLSDDMLALVAQQFRVLSDPMRLKILRCLQDGEHTVGQLVDKISSSQPNVSKHLTVLRNAGLVSRRQEGNLAIFAIAAPFVFQLCEIVCSGIVAELEAKRVAFGVVESKNTQK